MAQAWRIDRKIPVWVWIAVGGIGLVAILVGEAMLIQAFAAYQGPLAQFSKDHFAIDEAQFLALQPVPAPSEWARSEGMVGNWILAGGLVLAAVAAMIRFSKVRIRWLVLRFVGALLLAVSAGATAVYMLRPTALQFMYVNSGDCVEGCYYIPQPIGGWLETVAIAVFLSGLICVVLGVAAIVRSLTAERRRAV